MPDKVYKVKKIPLERRLLWARWDKIINMSGAEIRTFRTSDEGKKVGWTSEQAKRGSISGMAGQDASKKIESMISKAGRFRGQHSKMPPWSPEEWTLANKQIAYISRARGNIGDLVDDNDERTPKAKAMMLWGRDEIRSRGNFPDKDTIKDTLKKQVFGESHLDIANYLLG